MDTFDVKELDYDPRAENSNNLLEEEILITADCPWIIPNGSPFFAKDIKLFGNGGAPLKVNQHYKLEVGLTPLRGITGKEVFSFIKLTPTTLAAYTKITVRYRSVGVRYFPRNGIEDWITKIKEGAAHADWNTNVINKPLTYPASDHWHDMNTEIGDWDELTWFFQAMANRNSSDDNTAAKDAVEKLEKTAFASVSTPYKTCLDIINTHDVNYANPHKTTKAHLLLGNVANIGTGTIADHVSSDNDNLLATPGGIAEILAGKKINDSSIMRVGSLPISLLGNGTYIPPLIDGSFEGIGSRFETGAMCLEPNGDLMVLGNQYDGRADGLYFTTLPDPSKSRGVNNFTAYKYQNAQLKALGVEPNYVMGGSGPDLILVGDLADNQYAYISFTNGTLDPAKHEYVKVDVSAITEGSMASIKGTLGLNNCTLLLMGDYIYICTRISTPGVSGEATGSKLFKIPTSAIRDKIGAKFELQTLTYKDMNDVSVTDFDYFRFAQSIVTTDDAGVKTEKYCLTYTPQPTWQSHGWRSLKIFACPVPNSKLYAIRFRTNCSFSYTYAGSTTSNSYNTTMDVVYHMDPATGVMTRKDMTTPAVIKFDEMGHEGVDPIIYDTNQVSSAFHFTMAYQSGIIAPNGAMYGTYTDDPKTYPRYIIELKIPGLTRYQMLMSIFSRSRTPTLTQRTFGYKLKSPLASGTYLNQLMFDGSNEWYYGNPGSGGNRQWYYRKVTGDWIEREGIFNKDLENLKSRPLTMNVYHTDFRRGAPLIGVTGDNATLLAKNVSMGNSGFGGINMVNYNPAIGNTSWESALDGKLVSWPRTFTLEFDEGAKEAKCVYSSYYSLETSLVDKIYGLIPSDVTIEQCAFNLILPDDVIGPMFTGFNYGFLTVAWIPTGKNYMSYIFAVIRPTIESPNSNHPSSYLVKDFTVLSQYLKDRAQANLTRRTFTLTGNDETANVTGYRKEGRTYWLINSGIEVTAIGTRPNPLITIEVNDDGSVNNEPSLACPGNWYSVSRPISVPRLGLGAPKSINGGAALTGSYPEESNFDRSGNYLLASVYPEVGWILFFQEGTPVVFNGTDYLMPQGSIDLRDIDPDPRNKTFYVYATVVGSTTKYFVSSIEMSQGPFLIKAAVVVTNEKQIFSINRYQTFMVGSYVIQPNREGGTIPVSNGLPMEEGSLNYFTKQDLGIH